MFSRFDTILACERQTDGRTDGAEHRVVKKRRVIKYSRNVSCCGNIE